MGLSASAGQSNWLCALHPGINGPTAHKQTVMTNQPKTKAEQSSASAAVIRVEAVDAEPHLCFNVHAAIQPYSQPANQPTSLSSDPLPRNIFLCGRWCDG